MESAELQPSIVLRRLMYVHQPGNHGNLLDAADILTWILKNVPVMPQSIVLDYHTRDLCIVFHLVAFRLLILVRFMMVGGFVRSD